MDNLHVGAEFFTGRRPILLLSYCDVSNYSLPRDIDSMESFFIPRILLI